MVYAVRFHGESNKSCKGLKAILSKFTHKVIDRFDARLWIFYMNFVTSPCHDVSPKGKDSSVGESPPTLRWPYFKEFGCC